MREWENPISVKDIRSFFGFANYYKRFIQNSATIASPMTMLSKKDVIWHCDHLQDRAFETLKTSLCTASLLIYLDPSLLYTTVSVLLGMLLEKY